MVPVVPTDGIRGINCSWERQTLPKAKTSLFRFVAQMRFVKLK